MATAMDIHKKTRYATADTESMWETLVATFTGIMNDHGSQLEKILNMIRTDITYDDPGLFPATLLTTDAERKMCRECNFWFVYQLLRISSMEEYLSISASYTSLQKEMVNACFIKQRWLAMEISKEFIKLLDQMNDFKTDDKVAISAFYDYFINASMFGNNHKLRQIEITSTAQCRMVRLHCLHSLNETMSIVAKDQCEETAEFLRAGTFAVLRTLSCGDLMEKSACILFFRNYYQHNEKTFLCSYSANLSVDLMALIVTSLNLVNAWHSLQFVRYQAINQYITALFHLYCALNNSSFLRTVNIDLAHKLNIVVADLLTNAKNMLQMDEGIDRTSTEKLCYQLTIFLRKLSTSSTCTNTVISALSRSPEAIMVGLYGAIVDELLQKANHDPSGQSNRIESYSTISVHKLSTVWANVLVQIEQNSKLLKHAIILANTVSFKLQTHQLDAMRKNINTANQLYVFFDSNPKLLDTESLMLICSESPNDLMDLCFNIIHIADCKLLGENQQRALLQILSRPFEEAKLNDNDGGTSNAYFKINLCCRAVARMCNLQVDYLNKEVVKSYFTEYLVQFLVHIAASECVAVKQSLLEHFKQLILSSKISLSILFDKVFLPFLSNSDENAFTHIIEILNLLCCIKSGNITNFRVYQISSTERVFECDECNYFKQSNSNSHEGYYLKTATQCLLAQGQSLVLDSHVRNTLLRTIDKIDEIIWMAWTNFLPSALKHTTLVDAEFIPHWIRIFSGNFAEVSHRMSFGVRTVVQIMFERYSNKPEEYEKFIRLLLEQLLSATKYCHTNQTPYRHQSTIIRTIVEFADAQYYMQSKPKSSESMEILSQCVQLLLFFLMQPESPATHEASVAIAEMCARQKINPWSILSSYRHDVIKLIMGIAVSNYSLAEVTLHQSMNIVSHTFGCRDPLDFVSKQYKIMMAMLLPWCLKLPKCENLLREISVIVRKDLVAMLSASFLTIYTYLFISETVDITNQCIEYIMKLTGNSFFHLLHSDIKRTVSEVLVFYHINPECVMNVIRSLLSKNNDDVSTVLVAEYIAERFLGVLANFEATLVNFDEEKYLKRQILLSLGDIIRLLGGELITPFRFKIIALLRTALTLSTEDTTLVKHCVKVWRIFVCTVDVRQLGSLLSTIFVTLEPLLISHAEDIRYIFRYLVIENNNLLGNYIGDLFFIEDMDVPKEVKKIVSSRIAIQENVDANNRFALRLEELIRHCNHENLKIRIFALSHLCRICENNRIELNEAVLGQHQRISLGTIASLVETLIRGLSEQETHLQQRAAECLGELGALAPSHLPPNYAPNGLGFATSIHSDAFAVIALRELCRAYQRQKDSKFVDSFSLAIQEVLNERGVSPTANKKRDVWETIPERLRPIMEPLLSSCYTTVSKTTSPVLHSVFNNVRSSHEWSYQWASQLIENIMQDSTRNLLRAFKPSLRCDRGTLMIMLPYILLHSLQLCEGVEQRNRIAGELQTVFNAAIMSSNSPSTLSMVVNSNEKIQQDATFGTAEMICMTQEQPDTSGKELSLHCAKYAFGLFDFLERWRRQRHKEDTIQNKEHTNNRHDFDVVDDFLNKFDCMLLAKVNFKCHEYARALQYVEQSSYGKARNEGLQEKLPFLAEIYSRLGDTDSVEGVMALKTTEPTLQEQILYHNATGRLHEAVACYERLLQLNSAEKQPPKLDDLNSMIECYLRLDQPETALLLAESLLTRFHDTTLYGPLLDIQAEPLYRLGRFEELEELLLQRQSDVSEGVIDSEDRHWGVICGSLMVEYRQPNYERFRSEIQRARLQVIRGGCNERVSSRLSDEQLGSYEKRYEQTLKLHIISEFEKCGHIMRSLRSIEHKGNSANSATASMIDDIRRVMNNLNLKLEILQPNATTLEPIISLRRILLKEIRTTVDETQWGEGSDKSNAIRLREVIDKMIGELWMKSTELASRANMYQQALLYILHAESYRPRDLFIKNAKLLWDRRDMTGALKVLERGVNEIVSEAAVVDPKMLPKEHRLIYAEGKRLIAVYNAEASNISANVNRRFFAEAVRLDPESEVGLVQLAQYIDKLYNACPVSEQDTPYYWEMILEVMKSYGKSMMYGSSYIYQSMPRVLSIWLDSTAKTLPKSVELSNTSATSKQNIANSMNKLANKFKEILSPYFFFTAFSQLISRVAHPSLDTFHVLKGIIAKLLMNYPQQTLWMMLSVYKSSYTNRVRRCVEIFSDNQLMQTAEMQKLIKDFNALAERLIELTNKEIAGTGVGSTVKVTVSSLVNALPKLLADKHFSNVLIPIEQCMHLVLNKNTGVKFQPYPTNAIYLVGIEEEVTVLHSLQKPRKITLRGHNGKRYTMMLKPKDDLRKDFRLMEFNAVVKQYLAQNPDAKFRRLYIRTYAVMPLNEECGIIEWIPNLNTFRGIVYTYYKQRGLGMAAKEVRNYNYGRTESLTKKRDVFESILLPRHPPVFREWFRDCFPNPHNWFQARTTYIKTTAVISMVGYILGLGDRHGENILFDSTNGDTVHVDFNCLFNRGETLQIPELVPFRLTHNMVDAMGPLGVEGLYRRCCEIVLRLLQSHAPTFMSVLKPFVYDPMVSWSKISSSSYGHSGQNNRDTTNTERTDPQAMHNVMNIEQRLKGYVKVNSKLSHIPLSIEGQVNHLIKEATDIDNLAQMYIGWSSYT